MDDDGIYEERTEPDNIQALEINSPWVSSGQAELHGKAALYKVEFPFVACSLGSG